MGVWVNLIVRDGEKGKASVVVRQKIAAFVQARMTSTRLPGKVLAEVGGKPILQYILERLQQVRQLDQIVVLTSREPSDYPIADFCVNRGFPCFCGDLQNVAKRFCDAMNHYAVDAFVRICADSPLIDPALIERAISVFVDGQYDLVTNLFPRTFPQGQSVEVIRANSFRSTMPQIQKPEHCEHVTKYFYDHYSQFSIFNMESPTDYSHMKLTIDTSTDLKTFSRILDGLDRPHWEYGLAEILEMDRPTMMTVEL